MIKKLLFVLTAFCCSTLFAQDPELIETRWFLEKVTVSGTDHFPPVNSEVLNVQLFFEDNGFGPALVSNVCDQLYGEPVSFGTGFFEIESLVQTLGGCFDSENTAFQLLYFQHYYFNVDESYFYEITNDANGGKSMTITVQNGDIAYYQNSVLAVAQNNVISAEISPNPATDTFSIKSTVSVERVNIYGIAGNLLFSEENPARTINISTLATGVYFVEVTLGKQRSIQKLIKK